ncbi:MAG TPA: DUF1800 domain-containing protein [Vicinamibacterales bacterium]|nr:DUF1800 domain-containing protein [Vicinamibacterales bacterium]
MAPTREETIAHLFRRAGFGASDADLTTFAQAGIGGFTASVSYLVNYQAQSDDVDQYIGAPGYVGTTSRGAFSPATVIDDARQRWLFRMVHSKRPLQEKMALFWHNHFATAYSKIAGDAGADQATRLLAAKPSEDPAGVKGQLELLREHALGNFRDLLVAVAQDPAMLFWLDGRSNVKAHPQENFARELMELFTMGVDTFAETDVYAGARVFTGWNLARSGTGAAARYTFTFVPSQHDTTAKEFTFPIYADGGKIIPARSGSAGMQDGLDLLDAVAAHPATGPRLARKLYAFFVNEVDAPDESLIDELAAIYYARRFEIEPMVRRLLLSPQFADPANFYKRYSWPAEFVVRSLKEVGWTGFSVGDALAPLANMGQQLLEPPDVSGWHIGEGWFSTGAMLARMNFAAQLATNQKFRLRDALRGAGSTPDALLSEALDRLHPLEYDRDGRSALLGYLDGAGAWSGSDSQLLVKVPGLVHLIVGSGEYQLI